MQHHQYKDKGVQASSSPSVCPCQCGRLGAKNKKTAKIVEELGDELRERKRKRRPWMGELKEEDKENRVPPLQSSQSAGAQMKK